MIMHPSFRMHSARNMIYNWYLLMWGTDNDSTKLEYLLEPHT